jgi:aminopeptidase N
MSAEPEAGISLSLARERARTIGDVRYDLALDIPADPSDPIQGRVAIDLTLAETSQPLVLDFGAGPNHVRSVSVGGRPLAYRLVNGHVVIHAGELTTGEHRIEITFRAGDAAVHRTGQLVYSLFVPARAHLTFPCFDQPDLKARYTLELTVPAGWKAVSNAGEVSREPDRERVRLRFAESPPLPTYLFGFASGDLQIESIAEGGRTLRMFHRETDAAQVFRNKQAIFRLHLSSLEWLEEYTALPYPFGKFDFVLIPSFQFNGMEHPGAVFYNAASLLLDESATQKEVLARANLVAHETAHMWFGNLVTMRWFDDVWMKEVFANFLAAKIVNPAFPDVNHDLQFLVAHVPAAYGVDRTAGTHPIRQPLDNLNAASSLYGPVIYHKAPIVMRQLERLIGTERLREALRAFLAQFRFGNAGWPDLLKLLAPRTEVDVVGWSRAWVEQSGRPTIRTDVERSAEGDVQQLAFTESDPDPARSLHWPQQVDIFVGSSTALERVPVTFGFERNEVPDVSSSGPVEFVLPAGGLGYGTFVLDEGSRTFLLGRVAELGDPLARGTAWITLWDDLLDRRVGASVFVDAALGALASENNEQNVQLITSYLQEAFWRFLTSTARESVSKRLEHSLHAGWERARSSSLKATCFAAFLSTATTRAALEFLERIWRREARIAGLTLGEKDEASLALGLAVHDVPAAAAIVQEQRTRFVDPERRARFEFVMPAVSPEQQVRDNFFWGLSEVNNRRREPWVIEGLTFLHHPLRAAVSLKYLEPALELLVDIRDTGDIFFPKNWTDATLSGHNSAAAAAVVRRFLASRPAYPTALRRIVLQSADNLFRAAEAPDS